MLVILGIASTIKNSLTNLPNCIARPYIITTCRILINDDIQHVHRIMIC